MEENNFLEHFCSVFDEVEVSDLSMDTNFREIDEWSSLAALGLLAVMEEEYGVTLSNDDIKKSVTIRDIYNIVNTQ
jgi:acyl carrier protein